MLANFSSLVHEIVQSRVKGVEGDVNKKGTHAHNLEKARVTVFSKLLLLLNEMRTNSAFSKFQVRVGGRFPKEEYEGCVLQDLTTGEITCRTDRLTMPPSLIDSIQRILNYLALMAYASQTLSLHSNHTASNPTEQSQWSSDFRRLVTDAHSTSNQITSVLSLLSSCLSNGQALPPYLELPQPYAFTQRIEAIDGNILSVRHIDEPEYSAFAVLQICGGCVTADLEGLVG